MNLSEMNPHQTKIIPLIGSPIGGSTSPFVHNYLFDLYKVNAMTIPVDIKKGELPVFIETAKLMNFPGFILTSPHKADIIPLVDEVDETSKIFKSVNVVRIRNGKTEGHGMDGKGVIGAFDAAGVNLEGKEVLMIGAGGVSGVFASELASRGIKKLTVLNRTLDKAKYVAETLASRTNVATVYGGFTRENACNAARSANVFLQATVLGMKGSGSDYEELDFIDELPKDSWVMEAISNPPETTLVKKAKARGLNTILGMDMLVSQLSALFDFLLDYKLSDEGKKIATDFYCRHFKYKR